MPLWIHLLSVVLVLAGHGWIAFGMPENFHDSDGIGTEI